MGVICSDFAPFVAYFACASHSDKDVPFIISRKCSPGKFAFWLVQTPHLTIGGPSNLNSQEVTPWSCWLMYGTKLSIISYLKGGDAAAIEGAKLAHDTAMQYRKLLIASAAQTAYVAYAAP